MNLRLRPLLLATGALLLTAASASAQFIELVTEAPVTIQVSLTTSDASLAASTRKITATTTRLTQAQILEELRLAGVFTDTTSVGWSLVAVRSAPADLAFVDASFSLFAVKGATHALVPDTKFRAAAYSSVAKYTERHQGQYIYSSKGTVTNHVGYDYRPVFTSGSSTFTVGQSASEGFATIQYATKDLSDNYGIFFYAISSLRVTALGSFSGQSQIGSGTPTDTEGLISLTISVGTPKLVPATLYPGVATYPGLD